MGTQKANMGNVWNECGGQVAPDCVVTVPTALGATIPEALETFFNEKLRGSSAAVSGADAKSHVGVVIDAKYAIARGGGLGSLSTPTSGYQYQMLAYSLLVENCVAAVLFHPSAAGKSEEAIGASKHRSFRRLVPKPPERPPHEVPNQPNTGHHADCILMVMEHPFPSYKQCDDEKGWEQYLQEVRAYIGNRLKAEYAAALNGDPTA